MVSLVVSTVLTAFGNYLDSILPFGQVILTVLNLVVSLVLISFLFAAIYKVLPDRNLEWCDVVVGAIVTGVLFTIGKTLISWYIGSSAVASSFGAAGALIVPAFEPRGSPGDLNLMLRTLVASVAPLVRERATVRDHVRKSGTQAL
jgi:uncharacterized BrkB/YihY/UPF0761 family membrane protein